MVTKWFISVNVVHAAKVRPMINEELNKKRCDKVTTLAQNSDVVGMTTPKNGTTPDNWKPRKTELETNDPIRKKKLKHNHSELDSGFISFRSTTDISSIGQRSDVETLTASFSNINQAGAIETRNTESGPVLVFGRNDQTVSLEDPPSAAGSRKVLGNCQETLISLTLPEIFTELIKSIDNEAGSLLKFLSDTGRIQKETSLLLFSPQTTRFLLKEEERKINSGSKSGESIVVSIEKKHLTCVKDFIWHYSLR